VNLPAVSVIIPCYQQAEYLAEAVESVVAQTFTDWESVIIDDGSPDATAAMAEKLIASHPDRRIRLVRQANQGLPSARNSGIAASAGRYILPLDADDLLMPEMLARTVGLLESDPTVAKDYAFYTAVGGGLGTSGELWHRWHPPSPETDPNHPLNRANKAHAAELGYTG